jgi:hypothetical protein
LDEDSGIEVLRSLAMSDLLMILSTIAFFLVAIAYTVACDKLK